MVNQCAYEGAFVCLGAFICVHIYVRAKALLTLCINTCQKDKVRLFNFIEKDMG